MIVESNIFCYLFTESKVPSVDKEHLFHFLRLRKLFPSHTYTCVRAHTHTVFLDKISTDDLLNVSLGMSCIHFWSAKFYQNTRHMTIVQFSDLFAIYEQAVGLASSTASIHINTNVFKCGGF